MIPEIETEIDNRPELATAGKAVILKAFNTPGTAKNEAWTTSPVPVDVSWQLILTKLSPASGGRFYDALENPTDDILKIMKLYHNMQRNVDIAYPATVELVNAMNTAGIITTDERDAIIRLGQVKKSFAQEVMGRDMVEEDLK